MPDPSPSRLRRLAIILAVSIAVAGAAIGIALALDDPVGAGARDEAQAAAPGTIADPGTATAPSATTTTGGDTDSSGDAERPPLALVLDTPVPAGLRDMSVREQAIALRAQVAQGGTAADWVRLGSLLQQLGGGPMAAASYRAALQLDPGNLGALVGLQLVDASTGAAGARRAAAQLAALAAANPRSQIVAFNQGWLAAYRGQAGPARAAWVRTIALGADTYLGRSAVTVVEALEKSAASRNP